MTYSDDCLAKINRIIGQDLFTEKDATELLQTIVSLNGYLVRGGFLPHDWRNAERREQPTS